MTQPTPSLRGVRCAAFALAIALAGSGQSAPIPTPAAVPAPPRSLALPDGALVAPGQPADLELLFTGDVIGFVEPCG